MRLIRTVTIAKPLDKVFAYLADFTTTTEWDPGTVQTVRTAGDGGFGTEYLNTSTFAGESASAPPSCSFSRPLRAAQHMTLEKV